MTTRSPRPRSVRATTVLPRRVTSRWPSGAQRRLDRVGDLLLVVAHRLDVDQLLGERDGVGIEVQAWHGASQPAPPSRRGLPAVDLDRGRPRRQSWSPTGT